MRQRIDQTIDVDVVGDVNLADRENEVTVAEILLPEQVGLALVELVEECPRGQNRTCLKAEINRSDPRPHSMPVLTFENQLSRIVGTSTEQGPLAVDAHESAGGIGLAQTAGRSLKEHRFVDAQL